MHKLSILFTLLFLFGINACKTTDDTEMKLCFTPPFPFEFELVDKASGENLFTNETYDPKDIAVFNLDDRTRVDHTFVDENELNFIRINTIGWETEIVNYSLQISSENILELYVDAERLTEDGCNFTRYNEIRIDNAEYEMGTDTGIYTILIE